MIKFEFQNPDHNDTWKFIIAFCMTKPEGTPTVDLQRMLAEQFGIEASETACALAAIRFQEIYNDNLFGYGWSDC